MRKKEGTTVSEKERGRERYLRFRKKEGEKEETAVSEKERERERENCIFQFFYFFSSYHFKSVIQLEFLRFPYLCSLSSEKFI